MRNVGTRFTTACGHSWKRRYPYWSVRDMKGSTTDCKVCDAILVFPSEQFEGMDRDYYPANVHLVDFNEWMHKRNNQWPINGVDTDYVEF